MSRTLPAFTARMTRLAPPACVALLLLLGACAAEAERPNVVLVLIDTLRKDHLSTYGYERATSPRIDALASEGWVFEQHVASASQTVPSTLSLLLSQQPAEHGFVHEGPGHFSDRPPLYPAGLLFLQEVFQRAGYRTAGFVGNPFLTEKNGFSQGFDRYLYSSGRGWALTDRALQWLDEAGSRAAPFFLYLHYIDVHQPYAPPRSFLRRFDPPADGRLVQVDGLVDAVRPVDLEYMRAAYDGEIAYVDQQIGRLVDHLAEDGLLDATIFTVTSDHGDEFFEHGGLGHGTTVYGELVRVPLVVRYPALLEGGRRVTHLSSHLDLAPTLLAWAGLPAPDAFRGALLADPAAEAIAHNGPWRTVYSGTRKLIRNTRTGDEQVFALEDELDARALDPLMAGGAGQAELDRLRARLARYAELRPGLDPTTGDATYTPEELEELRKLGYVRD